MKTIWALVAAFLRLGVLAAALSTARTPWETAVICALALIYLTVESFQLAWTRNTTANAVTTWSHFSELRRILGRSEPDEEAEADEKVAIAKASMDGAPYYIRALSNGLLFVLALGALVVAAWG